MGRLAASGQSPEGCYRELLFVATFLSTDKAISVLCTSTGDSPMSIPHVAPASQLKPFKFYEQQAVHDAVLHEGVILKLAQIFSVDNRNDAYQFAYQLGQQYTALISPDSSWYRIWVDIRCPMALTQSLTTL